MTRAVDTVLITGAGGFLGGHLTRYLLSNGYRGRVIAYDNFSTGNLAQLDALRQRRLDIVTGDLRTDPLLDTVVSKAQVIFHLAAVSDPRACEADPELARSVNVEGTREILAASKGRRMVLLSTAAVYGEAGDAPITERSPLRGKGVYAETKLESERLAKEAHQAGDLEAVIVRNFNSYGGGQADGFLVPTLVKKGLAGNIEIWNCKPIRDFTFAEDTARAIAAIGLSEKAEGTFNLGTGIPTQVGALAVEVARLLDAPVSCLNKPVTGSACLLASAERVKRVVGWEPQVDLSEGIRRTIEWYQHSGPGASSYVSPSLRGRQAA